MKKTNNTFKILMASLLSYTFEYVLICFMNYFLYGFDSLKYSLMNSSLLNILLNKNIN